MKGLGHGPCGFGEKNFFVVFFPPIGSLWELSVAMETRAGSKPNATFPHLSDAPDKI